MDKIAVVGDYDSIYGFSALGLDTYAVTDRDAGEVLHKVTAGGYGIVYVTEAIAAKVPGVIEHYRELLSPAIILIPGATGNTGAGVDGVKKSVEQAIGSDILFGNPED